MKRVVSAMQSKWRGRSRRDRTVLVAGLLGVTLVAIAVRVPLLGTTYVSPDSGYYLKVAQGVFHGKGYASNLRPPGYPTLLAVLELFTSHPAHAAVLLQNLIGMVLPSLVLLVGWRFFGPLVGLIAGFLTAASPLMVAIEQFALTDYLFSVLLFLAVAVLAEAVLRMWDDSVPWPLLLAAGALFGLATLFRANGLYGLVAIPVVLLVAGPRWKPALRASGVAVAALAVVIAPWCVYSLVRFHDPNVASEGGLSLYGRAIGYDQVSPSPSTAHGRLALGIYNTADPNRQEAAVAATGGVLNALVEEAGLDQVDATGAMGSLAREAIVDHPGTYLKDSLQILGRYQGVYFPRTLTRNPGHDQIALATDYISALDPGGRPAPGGSALTRRPWEVGQGLTEVLFILTGGGLLMLLLPFLGERRSRLAAATFLIVGAMGIVGIALTARFELRHGVVFAPLVWVLAPATVLALLRAVVSPIAWPRARNATS